MTDEGELRTAQQRLGSELARLRRLAGIGGREMAARVGISQSKVSRIETGVGVPTLPEVVAWADAVSASEETRAHLVRLTEDVHSHVESWRNALRGRPHLQDQTRAVEESARTIQNFHPAIVPGLLQTAAYADRVLSLVAPDHDRAAAVAARMRRQEILYDQTRQLDFLVTEAALRWHSHDRDLIVPQMDRIASVATLANVWVGILPLTAAVPGLPEHNFQLYTDRDDGQEPVVRLELIHARMTVTEPLDVAVYREWFARWRGFAVDGTEAQSLLRRVADEAGT